jgi:hypothetical protein
MDLGTRTPANPPRGRALGGLFLHRTTPIARPGKATYGGTARRKKASEGGQQGSGAEKGVEPAQCPEDGAGCGSRVPASGSGHEAHQWALMGLLAALLSVGLWPKSRRFPDRAGRKSSPERFIGSPINSPDGRTRGRDCSEVRHEGPTSDSTDPGVCSQRR